MEDDPETVGMDRKGLHGVPFKKKNPPKRVWGLVMEDNKRMTMTYLGFMLAKLIAFCVLAFIYGFITGGK